MPAPTVTHEADGTRTIRIERSRGQKLGLDLVQQDNVIVVGKVHPGYAAAKGNLLQEGEVLVSINSHSVSGLTVAQTYSLVGAQPQGAISMQFAKKAAALSPPSA
jgi:C-terminal processing protease CtpA/Prc